MPIREETWKCEFCGVIWSSEADAKACENSHAKAISVKPKWYNRQNITYPETVSIAFSDGKEKIYERKT